MKTVLELQIFEAKGLEFNDVLLWNFFKDSAADKDWRVFYSYWYSSAKPLLHWVC
jgi:hypothetical protein